MSRAAVFENYFHEGVHFPNKSSSLDLCSHHVSDFSESLLGFFGS